MEPILISACLLGAACRYDGGSNPVLPVEALMGRCQLVPVCPEQLGGLPTPREPAERTEGGVVTKTGADVSAQFQRGAEQALHLVPDGVAATHALLAGFILLVGGEYPARLVVVAAVGVAYDDIDLLSGGVGESRAVAGVKRNNVGQIGDLLAVVVFHQPHGGVDVTGGRGGLLDCPSRLVEILPGEGLTGVDLCSKLLAVLGRSCVDQRAVVGDLGAVLLGGICFAVPVSRIGAVVGKTVAGGGEDNVHIVRVQRVGAAGEPAKVDGAGRHGLAGRVVAGADSDIDLVDVVAELAHLSLHELGQILGAGDDNVGILRGNELESQLVEVLIFSGLFGRSFRGSVSSSLSRGLGRGGSGGLAAGAQRENHHEGQEKCDNLLHSGISA